MDNATGAPAISVIVPCYNVEAYIDRALQSLREQTFENFEIIAVDDGSTDGTGARLRWWAEREPRLRIHGQENRGLYLARLSGIAQARGTWVTFMDADDELEPGHLAGLWGGRLMTWTWWSRVLWRLGWTVWYTATGLGSAE